MGETNVVIGEELNYAENTVKAWYRKLGVELGIGGNKAVLGIHCLNTVLTPEQLSEFLKSWIVQQYLAGLGLLTEREKEILNVIGSNPGITGAGIGALLFKSPDTVKTYMWRMAARLGYKGKRVGTLITVAFNACEGRDVPRVAKPTPTPHITQL